MLTLWSIFSPKKKQTEETLRRIEMARDAMKKSTHKEQVRMGLREKSEDDEPDK